MRDLIAPGALPRVALPASRRGVVRKVLLDRADLARVIERHQVGVLTRPADPLDSRARLG